MRLVSGGTPSTENQIYWTGSIPWITGADFTHYGLGEFRRFVSKEAIQRTATSIIDKGALLIVTRTGVGKLAIAPCDIAISQDITGVYPDQNRVDVEFLYHRMRLGVEDLRKLNQGTSIKGIVRKDLLDYPLDLPSLTQQHQIAQILSALDEAIEQTKTLIAKQQRIKTGLIQDLLTRGIDEDGNLRSEDTHEFKDSPLGRIPVEWESGHLFGRKSSGRPHLKTGPFGSSLKHKHWRATGVPVITIGALGAGGLIESELLHVSEATAMRLRNYRLEIGDIVFSRVADVGRSAVIDDPQHGWIMSSNLMRITLDSEQVDARFLQAQLSYESRIRQQILFFVNAAGRDVANTEILNRLQFLWPPPKEQARIMDRIEAFDDHMGCTAKELGKLRQVKTALMQDLLTGEVSVTPLLTEMEVRE